MENLIRWLLRKPKPTYAVIYDLYNGQTDEWDEEFYEMFSSKEQAIDMFDGAFFTMRQDIYNPRIVEIQEPLPGNWNTEREYRK